VFASSLRSCPSPVSVSPIFFLCFADVLHLLWFPYLLRTLKQNATVFPSRSCFLHSCTPSILTFRVPSAVFSFSSIPQFYLNCSLSFSCLHPSRGSLASRRHTLKCFISLYTCPPFSSILFFCRTSYSCLMMPGPFGVSVLLVVLHVDGPSLRMSPLQFLPFSLMP